MSKLLSRCWFFFAVLTLSCSVWAKTSIVAEGVIDVVPLSSLPAEVRQTLGLIKQGGPYPYAKDGVVFGNYEGVLPRQKRGYYHEFTVATPGERHRGARRIIVGGNAQKSGEYFYTQDHYRTFQRIRE